MEINIFRELRSRYDTDEKEFSAKELSKKIGLSPKVISVLENSEKNGHEPTLTELKAYHKEFNVPYEYLLGETNSSFYENQTINKELGLSDKSIEILAGYNHGKNGKSPIKYKDWEWPPIFESINIIIEEMSSPGSFLDLFTDYRKYQPMYKKKRFYTLHQDSGEITKTDNIDGMINIEPNLISFNADIIDNMFLMAIQDRLKEMKKNN